MGFTLKFERGEINFFCDGSSLSIEGGKLGNIILCPSALFAVTLKKTTTGETSVFDSAAKWRKVSISGDNPVTMTFSDPEGIKGVSVTLSAQTEKDSVVIDAFVDISNDDFSVMSALYPTPALTARKFSLFIPNGCGREIKNASERDFCFESVYPSHTVCMQYFALYDGIGGVYIGIEDNTAATKKFKAETNIGKAKFDVTCYAPNAGKAGNSFALFGKTRWQVYDGNWYHAALLYKKFVLNKCNWLPRKDENGRTNVPEKFRDVPFWIADYIPNTAYQRDNRPMSLSAGSDVYTPDYWVNAALELKKQLDVPVAYHVYNWHHNPFNVEYPHYFPAKEEFIAGAKILRENGLLVLPYINSVSWETRDAEAGHKVTFENSGINAAVKDERGNTVADPYPQTTISGKKVMLAPICPTCKLWSDIVCKIADEINETLPIDGIYFDEVAAHPSQLCFNEQHSHLPGGGSYWVEGYRDIMKRANMRKGDKYYFTECNAEPYADSFDGFLTWMWVQNEQVPAFSAVYAGYVQLIGRCTIGKKKEDYEFFKFSIAESLHYGQVPGWCKADIVYDKRYMRFLKPVVKLRYNYAAVFNAGNMLLPPDVNGSVKDKTTSAALYYNDDVVMRQAAASAWQTSDGEKTVIFLTNISEEENAVEVKFSLKETCIAKEALKERLPNTEISEDGDNCVLRTSLAPLECRALEFRSFKKTAYIRD